MSSAHRSGDSITIILTFYRHYNLNTMVLYTFILPKHYDIQVLHIIWVCLIFEVVLHDCTNVHNALWFHFEIVLLVSLQFFCFIFVCSYLSLLTFIYWYTCIGLHELQWYCGPPSLAPSLPPSLLPTYLPVPSS